VGVTKKIGMDEWRSILDHMPAAMLVIFRIGGMMIYAPVFGSPSIPVRIRVFLAFLIGLATYPLLSTHCIPQNLELNLWALAPLIALEITVGVVIGYLASLPLLAMETGGLIMGQQMGLGFARFYNPAIDDEADILGQMLFFMAVGLFLTMGGHESMVLAVLHSFEYVNVGSVVSGESIVDVVAGLMLASLELALRVAAPLLALVFLETVAMGFLAKTVPQLNILSLGFPLRILLGLTVVGVGLVVISDVAMGGVQEMFDALYEWLQRAATLGGGNSNG
jgi:flagellar biosynthesis protein FliR